jgi:hypothetical protein
VQIRSCQVRWWVGYLEIQGQSLWMMTGEGKGREGRGGNKRNLKPRAQRSGAWMAQTRANATVEKTKRVYVCVYICIGRYLVKPVLHLEFLPTSLPRPHADNKVCLPARSPGRCTRSSSCLCVNTTREESHAGFTVYHVVFCVQRQVDYDINCESDNTYLTNHTAN